MNPTILEVGPGNKLNFFLYSAYVFKIINLISIRV